MKRKRRKIVWVAALLACAVLACTSKPAGDGEGPKGGAGRPITLNGAGASFPYPIYAKWAYEFKKESGVGINYQSIGSGGGIRQIKAKSVDFGASDAPLEPEDLTAADLIQFPMVIGGVVPVVNIEGVAPGA
ncbi:MAG: substrate-binding domain-containing protein, partial [bacterium]|nr:substrate-binding domain-containing protein [bacterium]